MSLPDLFRAVIDVEAPRAWMGVATVLVIYGGKKMLDRLLPTGSSFRFMARWLDYEKDKDEGENGDG